MSDTPESQNPPQDESAAAPVEPPQTAAEPPAASTPEPTAEAPDGLAPSPGLAPPAGIQPPEVAPPAAPQYLPPQYQPPQFGPPQYQPGAPQAQPGQPQFPAGQPGAQPPVAGDPSAQPQPQQAPQWTPGPQADAPQPGAPGQLGQPGQYPSGAPDPGHPAPPKKGLPTGAIIGIVAGGVVLLLLIIAGIVAIATITTSGSRGSGAAPAASAGSAPQAVEEYLTALADGDAELARSFVDGTSSDTLLTDEVLEKSIELAPITDIVVDEDATSESDSESVVSATFSIGDESVTRDFRVWNYSDEWQIFDGLVNLSVSSFDGLDVTVNGVEPGDDYARAFIGTYQIELGVEEFQVSGDTDTFTLATDEDSTAMYDIAPVLTEEATQEFRDLVRASLTECVALTSLSTPCGLDVTGPLSDGAVPVDGTIQRTITAEGEAALNALQAEPSYDTPTVVSSYDYIQIDTTLEADKDGQRVSGDLLFGGNLLKPYVDFAQESPKVTWE